jgi:hypothetical protein
MKLSINHVLWYGHQYLKALGFWGCLGCLIIILTAFFFPLTDLTSAIKSQSKAKEASKVLIAPPSIAKDNDAIRLKIEREKSTNDLSSMLSLLPDEHQLPSVLNKMHQEAKIARLPIASADYKWRKLPQIVHFTNGSLVEYEITFTVEGSYTAIRNMINAVLAQIPTLALSNLELKRESVDTTLTEANVTFVIFVIRGNE